MGNPRTTGHSRPAAVVERFAELLAEGDLEGMLELYEPDAAFAPQPGETVTGRKQIRAALEGFLAVKPRMDGTIEKVLEAGDTALVTNRWRLAGTAPDGTPVRMAATSADVLRRRSDGSWGIVIDDPWGAAG
jgi:uncharacterized protein (TIGR02246 family)